MSEHCQCGHDRSFHRSRHGPCSKVCNLTDVECECEAFEIRIIRRRPTPPPKPTHADTAGELEKRVGCGAETYNGRPSWDSACGLASYCIDCALKHRAATELRELKETNWTLLIQLFLARKALKMAREEDEADLTPEEAEMIDEFLSKENPND